MLSIFWVSCAMALLLFAISYLQNYTSINSNVDKLSKSNEEHPLSSIGSSLAEDPRVDVAVPAAKPRPKLVPPLEGRRRVHPNDHDLQDDWNLFERYPYLEHLRSK